MSAKQRAARARFKAAVAEAKKLRKKNPKLTNTQALRQAFAISYGKKRAKVGAAKKSKPTKVKAKKSKPTSDMHKDTKSHNVNIRVVSGLSKITGIPHKAKYYISYKENGIKRIEYFDKLPKDYVRSVGGNLFLYRRQFDGTNPLFPIKSVKNNKQVKKR